MCRHVHYPKAIYFPDQWGESLQNQDLFYVLLLRTAQTATSTRDETSNFLNI